MGHIDIECLIYRQSIKMKFVVAFLACIVAAQAATFSCPSYEYWCAHSFHVLPRSHYYCHRFHFNHAWCTGAYYRDILVEFPMAHYPKGCEAEDQAEGRVQEMIRKLAAAREEIRGTLMMPQGNWIKNLCEMNDYYVAISRTTSIVTTKHTPSTCSTKDARPTVLNSKPSRNKLSDATTNKSTLS